MSVRIVHGDARNLPLDDNSVDLVVTSPPYFGLRSYTDNGEHYGGQLGAEPTPAEFVDALIECTAEMMRVVKPTGSIWVNLGDKYSQRVATRPSSHQDGLFKDRPELKKDWKRDRAAGLARMPRENVIDPESGAYVPEKSLMGLPWRYALRCIDDLGLILRAEVVWSKANGMPESVTDRVRRSHEQWFHFTLSPRYYAAVDRVREGTKPNQSPSALSFNRNGRGTAPGQSMAPHRIGREDQGLHARGKLPGSVQTVATEPLRLPDHLGVDHYAAFPTWWPRWIIQGWSPEDGVVLDPFGGTGTTALVADALGRDGISVDMSADYCRVARWRTNDPKQRAKAAGVAYTPAPEQIDGQDAFDFGDLQEGTA